MKETQAVDAELMENDDDLEALIPKMNVSVPEMPQPQPKPPIVQPEQMLGLYSEIVEMTRADREETGDLLNNFIDLVFNGGDGSSASKEAIVQLMKLKMDSSNNIAKVADMMTRIVLRDRNDGGESKPWLNAHQNNTINISGDKKELLKMLNKKKQQGAA
jgi:hypothetical protein